MLEFVPARDRGDPAGRAGSRDEAPTGAVGSGAAGTPRRASGVALRAAVGGRFRRAAAGHGRLGAAGASSNDPIFSARLDGGSVIVEVTNIKPLCTT